MELSEDVMKQEENKAVCTACLQFLDAHFEWQDDLSQDDLCSSYQMLNYCENKLSTGQWENLKRIVETARERVRAVTAWRIEGTLREFPKFEPVNLWFKYPVHQIDDVGILNDIQPDAEKPYWQKGKETRKKQGEAQRKDKQERYNIAIENFRFGHNDTYPTVKELYEQMKSDAESIGEKYPAEKTIWNSLKKLGYTTDKDTKRIVPLPSDSGAGNG